MLSSTTRQAPRSGPPTELQERRRGALDLTPDGKSLAILVSVYLLLTTVPPLVKRLILGRSFDSDALAGEIANPLSVTILGMFFGAALAIVSSLILLRRTAILSRSLKSPVLGALVAITAWSVCFLGSSPAWASVIINVIFLVGIVVLRPKLSDMRVFAYLGAALAAFSIAYGIVDETAWRAGTLTVEDTKALIGSGILAGPYQSSNNLGMGLAMALPFSYLIANRWVRVTSVGIMLFALILTASRSSLVALLVLGGVVLILSAVARGRDRMITYIFVIVPLLGVSALFPWMVNSAGAYTSRGGIWLASREAISIQPVQGWGFDAYARDGVVAQINGAIAPAGHNILLHYWVVAGAVGLCAMGWILSILVARSGVLLRESMVPAAFAVVLIVLSMTEMPLRPEAAVGQAWIALPAVSLIVMKHQPSSSMA